VAFLSTNALHKLGIPLSQTSAIVQGFGNVGSYTAKTLSSYGVKITGISDASGALWNAGGIDVAALRAYVAQHGVVKGFPGADVIDPEEMLCQPCDVLAPAAMERAIHSKYAPRLQCRILAEGANGPTTPEADRIIDERGDIFVIPDILCNAGGVTVSYFEWVQNFQRFQWNECEVISKLETMMQRAFEKVTSFSERNKVSMRMAAQAIAIKTVADAKALRGLFP
jgi:glutamate dehydrogenase (NAD(P)+)